MKRELLSKAFGSIDDRFVLEAYHPVRKDASGSSERSAHMNKKRIITFALAAALMFTLGITAYAVWNIHAARQQELKADLKIDENNVSSYMEYDVPDESAGNLVLLSAVSDGLQQRVYVNISPVSEETATAGLDNTWFIWTIQGTEVSGPAEPVVIPSDTEASNDSMPEYSYDRETQTLTLQCYLDLTTMENFLAPLDSGSFSLQVQMFVGTNEPRTFGPVSFALTEEQSRYFDFGHARYYDEETRTEIEIVGLELTPFSAVWKVHYKGDEFHAHQARGESWDAYLPWLQLEDRVCNNILIYFSDGSSFSTGGDLNTSYEDGVVNLNCSWLRAINIDDVRQIVLGDVILWEAE